MDKPKPCPVCGEVDPRKKALWTAKQNLKHTKPAQVDYMGVPLEEFDREELIKIVSRTAFLNEVLGRKS